MINLRAVMEMTRMSLIKVTVMILLKIIMA